MIRPGRPRPDPHGYPGPPPVLDRMHAGRRARLAVELDTAGVDAMVLAGTSNVEYATAATGSPTDAATAAVLRPVAVVVRGEPFPHVFTPFPSLVPPGAPADHVHPGLDMGPAAGPAVLAEVISELVGSRPAVVAVDEWTGALLGAGLDRDAGPTPPIPPVPATPAGAANPAAAPSPAGARRFLGLPGGIELVDAGPMMARARLCKSEDEISCIARAQLVNERAMEDVARALRPGVRQSELTGLFLQRVLELGADGLALDPIWQVMPTVDTPPPATTHGGLAFPLTSTDRVLRAGDVVWVDSGVVSGGYVSDFGCTWVVDVDPAPSPALVGAFDRWRDIVRAVLDLVRPGATGSELVDAALEAAGGATPWPPHFYLAHGLGLDSAEAPLIGTDRGRAADESVVLAPGMVLVLEPETWQQGGAGYRAELVLAVTDDGFRMLSSDLGWSAP